MSIKPTTEKNCSTCTYTEEGSLSNCLRPGVDVLGPKTKESVCAKWSGNRYSKCDCFLCNPDKKKIKSIEIEEDDQDNLY